MDDQVKLLAEEAALYLDDQMPFHAGAIRHFIAAATKPPVVGLTEEERNAIEVARFFVAAHGGGKSFEVIDTLDAMLDRDPGEYAVVRKTDLANVVDLAVVLLDGQLCDAARGSSLEDLGRLVGVEVFTPAIAKGGEPGALG
jgi:hypothetical protein